MSEMEDGLFLILIIGGIGIGLFLGKAIIPWITSNNEILNNLRDLNAKMNLLLQALEKDKLNKDNQPK